MLGVDFGDIEEVLELEGGFLDLVIDIPLVFLEDIGEEDDF